MAISIPGQKIVSVEILPKIMIIVHFPQFTDIRSGIMIDTLLHLGNEFTALSGGTMQIHRGALCRGRGAGKALV